MSRIAGIACLTVLLLQARIGAQQLLWQIASTTDTIDRVAPSMGDLDHDGTEDLLVGYSANRFTGPYIPPSLRVYSGLTGVLLNSRPPTGVGATHLDGVGDFDLDGYPDYAVSWDDQGFQNLAYVQVWSPHLNAELLRISGPRPIVFGGTFAGRVEFDGDGLPDLLVASTASSASDVRAYSHNGALLWRVPFYTQNRLVLSVMGLQDINGDGRYEAVVGGTDYNAAYTRGFVAVYSGADGSLLRMTLDQGDIIGSPLASAGDMDRDGVEDYVTANTFGGSYSGRKIIDVFSGATGAVIRHWQIPIALANDLATSLVGGRDADLDGVPDVIAGSVQWQNAQFPLRSGRVQAFSSRDLQTLVYTEPEVDSYVPSYAVELADLGTSHDNPYPIVAFTYTNWSNPYNRLEVWRMSPPGATVSGVGCASSGPLPSSGVRRVDTVQGEQCRVVLGNAPPGAFAMLVAAGASESTFNGSLLPFSFAPLGFPGCNLYVPPTLTEVRTAGTAGFDRGYAELNAPFRLGTTGFGAAVQWLVLDFQTGSYAVTPRCQVTLQ